LKLPHLSKQNGQEKSSVTGMKGLMNHIRNRVVQGKERNKKLSQQKRFAMKNNKHVYSHDQHPTAQFMG
jgi:hypothetical protein